MAQTKLYAPKGMHFMVNSNGGFYLMKNPDSGYKPHTSSNGERSSLYISVEVKKYHATGSVNKSKGSIYSKKITERNERQEHLNTKQITPVSRTRKAKPSSRGGY